jgi:hypothetical protein
MSQAAGLQLAGHGNPPVVEQRLDVPAWITVLKAKNGESAPIKERLFSRPGIKVVGPGGGSGNGGNGASVPEPEGWAGLMALGVAGAIFGGYRFKQRRQVLVAA